MQQCLPEGLRNGASHQIVLKSEGGDVWHGAQLRWNVPNQLQPGYTVTHHAAYGQASHSTEKGGGKGKTTPLGLTYMRSQVLYQAAQAHT